MQQRFDGTSGYFNDVPYFSPVETTVFYEAVQNCRVHKLPGHLMVGPRSIPFFVKEGTEVARVLGNTFESATGTRATSASAVFPEFKTDFSSTQPLFKKNGSDFISIIETCQLTKTDASQDNINGVALTKINTVTINHIWTNLLLFLNGVSEATGKFQIKYADVSLAHSNGYGECLLSLLLAGLASILHFYSQKERCQTQLEAVAVEFIVLNTPEGASAADNIQFYLENKLRLSVTRCCDSNFVNVYDRLISEAQCFECCESDWVETVCREALDAHEMLIDTDVEVRGDTFVSPIVLLIVPYIVAARSALVSQILDSYSSEPLRVQSDSDWNLEELGRPSPVVFVCSATWLARQMDVPREENLICKLNIKVVIHGGFCETASTFEEEIMQCAIALQSCEVGNHEMRIARFQTPSFAKCGTEADCLETETGVQACGVTLLLLFRRFVMRFAPGSKQPFVTIPCELFYTQQSYHFFSNTVRILQAACILAARSEVSFDVLELTVLGRFLSFHFRICNSNTEPNLLTLSDGKAILWAFLLRQPLNVPQEIVKECHRLNTWVETAVARFCSDHQLAFDFQDGVSRRALVEQLARFGFRDGDVQNRVHYLLSSPTGTRFPLRPHLTGSVPTVCRGWYEQAPLNAGLALEKKEVNVVCLPPKATYCEMEVVEKEHRLRVQCPLELSYPIIVAHCIFHISLHNICVFSEAAEPSVVMPLPANLLETGVVHFLISGLVKTNAGLWLDGAMNEVTPAASDASVLAPLSLKGKRHIQYCEREVFTRKKRRLAVEPEKPSERDVFRGAVPRTTAERSAVEELVELIKSIGREKAEKVFRGKKGFSFLEASHELHPFYLYSLKQ